MTKKRQTINKDIIGNWRVDMEEYNEKYNKIFKKVSQIKSKIKDLNKNLKTDVIEAHILINTIHDMRLVLSALEEIVETLYQIESQRIDNNVSNPTNQDMKDIVKATIDYYKLSSVKS